MKKKVFDYFVNLDKQNLILDNHGIIVENSPNIKKISRQDPETFFIDNNVFFAKITGEIDDNLQSLAASDLYNQSGILNPPIYLTKDTTTTQTVKQITQDIRLPQFFDCRHPGNSDHYDFLRLKMPFNQSKWKVLYNPLLKDYFLSFMTEECFDEFISMFLLDELRTETDRHIFNYFLYKNKNTYKYEGIIALDFDLVEILTEDCLTKDSFNEFLKRKYYSVAPATNSVFDNHSNSMKRIRKLISLDKLSKGNIATLKKALRYDFPNKIKQLGEKHKVRDCDTNRVYTPYAYLWEFNRDILGKELGL